MLEIFHYIECGENQVEDLNWELRPCQWIHGTHSEGQWLNTNGFPHWVRQLLCCFVLCHNLALSDFYKRPSASFE